MGNFEELAFAILAQSDLSAEGLLKSQIDQETSVTLGLTAMGQFKSIAMIRCRAVDSETSRYHETLLRQTFDQYLQSNLIGSKTTDDSCVVTKLYLSGPGSADELEGDLVAMDDFLQGGVEHEPEQEVNLEDGQPSSEWVQV